MKKWILLLSLVTFRISASAAPTVVEAELKWKSTSIEVCWGTLDEFQAVNPGLGRKVKAQNRSSVSRSTQDLIQKKVQSEYTFEKTGIEFIGWQECAKSPTAKIVVYAVDSYEHKSSKLLGRADIGTADDDDQPNRERKGFVFLNQKLKKDDEKVTSLEKLLLTTLHEFGHAAGLRHEHIRQLAKDDKNCLGRIEEKEDDGETDLFDESKETAQFIGKYDPESIMNYCYGWYIKKKAGLESADQIQLSIHDRHTLLCMYAPHQVPAGTCEMKKFKK